MKVIERPSNEVEKLVNEIFAALYDRAAFDHWWDNIEDDIKDEIIDSIIEIIDRQMRK